MLRACAQPSMCTPMHGLYRPATCVHTHMHAYIYVGWIHVSLCASNMRSEAFHVYACDTHIHISIHIHHHHNTLRLLARAQFYRPSKSVIKRIWQISRSSVSFLACGIMIGHSLEAFCSHHAVPKLLRSFDTISKLLCAGCKNPR